MILNERVIWRIDRGETEESEEWEREWETERGGLMK